MLGRQTTKQKRGSAVTFAKDSQNHHEPKPRPSLLPQEHVEQWAELAVDYLDGNLDPATQAAVEAHLSSCADCARRLEEQRRVAERLRQTPALDPPAWLEKAVLEEILSPVTAVRAVTAAPPTAAGETGQPLRKKEPAWTRFWRQTLRPWAPAAIAVAAILLGIVSYGIFRQAAPESLPRFAQEAAPAVPGQASSTVESAPGDQVARASTEEAQATSARQQDSSTAILGGQQVETSTTAIAPTTTASSFAQAATSASVSASGMYRTLKSEPQAVTAETRSLVVEALENTDTPAYFVYASSSLEKPLTPYKASAVATQLCTLTGLEPLPVSMSLAGPTLAAYLPREDAGAFVELLLSIAASLELSLSLEFQPPETQSQAHTAIMENRSQFAELVARRAPSPGISGWTFSTSTSLAPDQQQNDALVIIFARQ